MEKPKSGEYHDCLNCELAHLATKAVIEEVHCPKELGLPEFHAVYKQHEINQTFGRHAMLYLEVFNRFSTQPKRELVLKFYGQLIGGWVLNLLN